jgi:hypothetical protein
MFVGNSTECIDSYCCAKDVFLNPIREDSVNISHGEIRFFSLDQSTVNCTECRTPEQVLKVRSNGDEVLTMFHNLSQLTLTKK